MDTYFSHMEKPFDTQVATFANLSATAELDRQLMNILGNVTTGKSIAIVIKSLDRLRTDIQYWKSIAKSFIHISNYRSFGSVSDINPTSKSIWSCSTVHVLRRFHWLLASEMARWPYFRRSCDLGVRGVLQGVMRWMSWISYASFHWGVEKASNYR